MQLSEKVDSLEKEVRLIKRIKPMNFFSTLEEIGLTPGTETIKDIVEHMPIPSTLTFQKLTNYGNNAIYPLASGSLTVVKRLAGRASLTFSGDYEDYRSFYNDVYAEPFVGWSKIESGITGSKVTDLNDAVEGLAYYSPSAPNTPAAGGSHYVQTFLPKQFNGEYSKQIAYRATGGGVNAALTSQTFIREKVANVWNPWRQLTNTFKGSGSPEGVVVASVGSFYFDTSSGNNDVYYKTTETLNTGWKPLAGSGNNGSYYVEASAQLVNGANEYAITLPGVTEYTNGLYLLINPSSASTSSANTINVNGLGSKYLTYPSGSVVQDAGDIVEGQVFGAVYNGVGFTVLGTQKITSSTNFGSESVAASALAVKTLNDTKANRQQQTSLVPNGNAGWNLSNSRYYKDEFGVVHFYLNAVVGNRAAVTFINIALPQGYKPSINLVLPYTSYNSSSPASKPQVMNISTDGSMFLQDAVDPGSNIAVGYFTFKTTP